MKNTICYLFSFVFLITSFSAFSQQNEVSKDQASNDTTKLDANSRLDDIPPLIPTSSINADVLETETQSQDVSSLLQSSRDVYTSIAGFSFGAARFRIRGYGSEHYAVLMNGVKLNDIETGWAIWANWGGLNDITRYQAVNNGISPSNLNFGGVGGSSNIEARASQLRKTTRFSYALANRSYNHRVMFTKSTGLMNNGWAFAFSGSIRYANEGYVEGTFYRAGSYFASAEKQINDKHSIGLFGFGAPANIGRRGIATQETYDLTGNSYYNPYWGYQTDAITGEKVKRNARERRNHKPMVFLTHYFNINKKSSLNSSLYYQFGTSANTGLNWYDAWDPRPDYYKSLPSFYEETNIGEFNALTDGWQNDPTVSQINWDHLYFSNSKNLYTVLDADGTVGNNVTGNRSKYIVEEAHQDPRMLGFNTNYFNSLNEKAKISGGLNVYHYTSKNYKIMDDLMGGDFWVDINQFAERDAKGDESIAQNNLEITNRVVRKGDIFGYNYDINLRKAEGFGQLEYRLPKIETYAAISLSTTSFWRTGYWQNGLYPDNSIGDSDKNNFFNYGVKGGATYKLTGRHFLTANGAYITAPPSVRNSFVSPQTRDHVTKGLTSSKTSSFDANYIVKYPNLKMRLTYFYTHIKDQPWLRRYYHEDFRTFINYNMTGVNYLNSGVELGFETKITSTVSLLGAFTKADYLYNSRPEATITIDNSSEVLAEDRTVYFKNYRVGGMPQTAGSIGLKYSSPKYWFFGADLNYFTDIYLDANPDRRTNEALDIFVDTDPQVSDLINQTKLGDGYVLNLSLGKSVRLKDKYYLNLNINVNNALNNTDLLTGGFEFARFDRLELDKFPAKLGYMYGRTYFLMASFRF